MKITIRTRTTLVALMALAAPAAAEKDKPDPDDVTQLARDMNSDKYGTPPTSFRPGHVTPRKLDPKAVSKNDKGFAVKLPSGAPIRTPSVMDGVIYASGGFHSREFYAIDAHSGQAKWALDIDDDGPSSPACSQGVCVFNTESCTLFSVKADTGELLWSYFLGDPLMSAPTVADGRVYTAYPAAGQAQGNKGGPPGASHALAAFDLKSGKILWQRWIDADVMSAPVATNGDLYVTSLAGTLYRFDPANGAIKSARRVRATSAPVVVGNDVYYTKRTDTDAKEGAHEAVISADRTSAKEAYQANAKSAPYLQHDVQMRAEMGEKGKALDASNGFGGGAPASANAGAAAGVVGQASVSTIQAYQGSRVLSYKGMNVNSMGDEVVATDAKSGKKLWSSKVDGDMQKSGGALVAPPAAAGERLIVGTLGGDIRLIDPKTGKVLKTYAVGSPIRQQPVVEGGWIYVGTEDGKIVAIDTGDAKLTGWSQWGKDAARTGSY